MLGGTLVHTLALNDGALGDPIDGLTAAELEGCRTWP